MEVHVFYIERLITLWTLLVSFLTYKLSDLECFVLIIHMYLLLNVMVVIEASIIIEINKSQLWLIFLEPKAVKVLSVAGLKQIKFLTSLLVSITAKFLKIIAISRFLCKATLVILSLL